MKRLIGCMILALCVSAGAQNSQANGCAADGSNCGDLRSLSLADKEMWFIPTVPLYGIIESGGDPPEWKLKSGLSDEMAVCEIPMAHLDLDIKRELKSCKISPNHTLDEVLTEMAEAVREMRISLNGENAKLRVENDNLRDILHCLMKSVSEHLAITMHPPKKTGSKSK